MKCPRDGTGLTSLNYEDSIYVDACPACNGVWLERGELEMVEEVIERDYSEELSRIPDYVGRAYEEARQKERRQVACPKCGGPMESREYAYCSQVVVDQCTRCGGVWLDRGELEAIEVFFERSKKERKKLVRSFLKGLAGIV
jgi:Zn-finger nucleic acid-binding protein